MINFRYHVVSLVAVFLSIGLGVLVGSSFIAEGTVRFLEATQRRLERTNDGLRDDNSSLERSNAALIELASRSKEPLIRGALTNRPVLLLVAFNTPEQAIAGVVSTLQQAGARIDGAFKLARNLDGTSEPRLRQIGQALETNVAEEGELRSLLYKRLIDTLSGQTPGVLDRLLLTELAEIVPIEGVEPNPASVPTRGTSIVLVAGETDGDQDFEKEFLLPVVRVLAESTIVAVCELTSEGTEVVQPLRHDPAPKLVTIDDVSGPVGQVGLALGLRAALQGRFGHYGAGEGASSAFPTGPP